MPAEYIKIKRYGHKFQVKRELTDEEKRNSWRRQKTITETLDIAPAKIISPRLALFRYEQGSTYIESRYHVIHIPTGLVIADITYDLMKDVKATFESSKWTLKGADTLCLYDDKFSFEMTCKIRYEIMKEVE
jgi:hypothetical protein